MQRINQGPVFGGQIKVYTGHTDQCVNKELADGISKIYKSFLPKAQQFGNDMFIGLEPTSKIGYRNCDRFDSIIIATGSDEVLAQTKGKSIADKKFKEIDETLVEKISEFIQGLKCRLDSLCPIFLHRNHNSGKITRTEDYIIVNSNKNFSSGVPDSVMLFKNNSDPMPMALKQYQSIRY